MFNFITSAIKEYIPTSVSLYNKSSSCLDSAAKLFDEGLPFQKEAIKDLTKVAVKGTSLAIASYSIFNSIGTIFGDAFLTSACTSFANVFAGSSELALADNLLAGAEKWVINNCEYLPRVSAGLAVITNPLQTLSIVEDGINFFSNEYQALKNLIPAAGNYLEGAALLTAGKVVESFEQMESAYNKLAHDDSNLIKVNTVSHDLELDDFKNEMEEKKQNILNKQIAFQEIIAETEEAKEKLSEDDLKAPILAPAYEGMIAQAEAQYEAALEAEKAVNETLDLIADWDVVEIVSSLESSKIEKVSTDFNSSVITDFNFEESVSNVLGNSCVFDSVAVEA